LIVLNFNQMRIRLRQGSGETRVRGRNVRTLRQAQGKRIRLRQGSGETRVRGRNVRTLRQAQGKND